MVSGWLLVIASISIRSVFNSLNVKVVLPTTYLSKGSFDQPNHVLPNRHQGAFAVINFHDVHWLFKYWKTSAEWYNVKIICGGKLSWLQHLVEICGKLLWLCHSCNTLLTSFMNISLENVCDSLTNQCSLRE